MSILKYFKELSNDFNPHPFIRGGFLQTIAGKLFREPTPWPLQREPLFVDFQDGDKVSFVIDMPEQTTHKKMFVLFHGLAGSADSSYNLRLSLKLRAQGFYVARYSHRGCGPVSGHAAKNIYHCGSTADMFESLKQLARHFPSYELYLIGFSLSGAVLLNLLGKHAADVDTLSNNIKAALAVCPPLDLEKSSVRLSRKRNFIFDQYFSRLLVQQVKEKEGRFPDLPLTNFRRSVSLREFDEIYTARFGGFSSRLHYYESSSASRALHQIKLPTLILGAEDDPIVCPDEFKEDYQNPNLHIILTKSGGHMGYMNARKTSFGDYWWMDEFVLAWARKAALGL